MKIFELIVEADREEHIARHGVSLEEVEAVVFSDPFITRAKRNTYRLIGQTEAGRYVVVFLGKRPGEGVFGLVTARDATSAERRAFHRHRGH